VAAGATALRAHRPRLLESLAMMPNVDPLPVPKLDGPFRVALTPPGSKSLANRALVLAALTPGVTTITNVPAEADDVAVVLRAFDAVLGIEVDRFEDRRGRQGVSIHGRSTEVKPFRILNQRTGDEEPRIDLHNAGTATRFLVGAIAAGTDAPVIVDGDARMRERPIADLVEPLRRLGARIDYVERDEALPLRISPADLHGGRLEIGVVPSSQFLSALLLLAPRLSEPLDLALTAPPTSPAYLGMTLDVLERFGVRFEHVEPDLSRIVVAPGPPRACEYAVEPDASGAGYFLAAAALTPGAVCTIEGLGKGSPQGDVLLADILGEMGAGLAFGADFITIIGPRDGRLRGTEVDGNLMPDAVVALAVVAAFAETPTVIRNVGHLRHKESDRLAALRAELRHLGAEMTIEDDGAFVEIEPKAVAADSAGPEQPTVIRTYDDHRLAMAFAIAGLRRGDLAIEHPACVAKSYPGFWADLDRLRSARSDGG